jgi:hypothetical protein
MAEYDISDTAPKTGEYVCSSCGEMSEFENDSDFAICTFCEDEDGKWVPAIIEDDEVKDKDEEYSEE